MTRNAGLSRRMQIIEGAVAWGVFCALAVVKTYPLVLHLDTPIPNDRDDPLLVAWILVWNVHALRTDPWHMPTVAAADEWDLKELCLASNGGLFYAHPEELRDCVELLLADEPSCEAMGVNSKRFAAAAVPPGGKHGC